MAAGDTLQLRSGSLGFGFYYITLCIELALPQWIFFTECWSWFLLQFWFLLHHPLYWISSTSVILFHWVLVSSSVLPATTQTQSFNLLLPSFSRSCIQCLCSPSMLVLLFRYSLFISDNMVVVNTYCRLVRKDYSLLQQYLPLHSLYLYLLLVFSIWRRLTTCHTW